MEPPSFATDPAAKRPPVCAAAPLLAILVPLIGGILAAGLSAPWQALGLTLGGVSVWLMGRHGRLLRHPRLGLAALAFGFCWSGLDEFPAHPDWQWLPPRETVLDIRLERLFNARKADHLAGLGRIEGPAAGLAPPHTAPLAFYLKTGALDPADLLPGAQVRCRGVLQFLQAVPDPDAYQNHLLEQEIFLSFNQGEMQRLLTAPSLVARARHWLQKKNESLLTAGCTAESDPGHVIGSMLLGKRSLLTEERMELYRRSGTLHLFAVSGLHVGSVALCVFTMASVLRLGSRPRLALVLIATWLYVWMTGATSSGVRAGIMLTAVSSARLFLRQGHLFPALVLSASIVLVWQPKQLFHLGFQLSYAVVVAIVLMALPLSQFIQEALLDRPPRFRPRTQRRYEKAVRYTADLVCIAFSSSLVSAPLIIEHFHLMTPGGILASLLLNALVVVIVSGAVIAMILQAVLGEGLAGTLVVMLWPLVDLIEGILRITLLLPGAVREAGWIIPGSGTATTIATLATAWGLQRLRMARPLFSRATLAIPLLIPVISIGFGTLHT